MGGRTIISLMLIFGARKARALEAPLGKSLAPRGFRSIQTYIC